MAQLGNLLVTGSSRLLGKLFCEDINISDSLVVKTLNANDITATSVTTSGLTVNGNATTTGTLNVGNSATNGKLSLNNKIAIRDNGYSWLGINDQIAFGSGVYFGKSTVRTDGTFQVGDSGSRVLFNTSSAKFSVPVTINNSLAANNITATNVTINDTLKAFKYELNTIQDLGGEFCVAPIIYIQSGATVNVSKASATTITVSILDKTAITSDSIQGVRWAQNSKIKFQGKIDGLNIRCSGVMAAKLNTTANTMSLTLTVESSIADHFSTAKNGASYSDISVMLYQRYGKKIGSTTKNVYSPVGIRMSAIGSANSAPYVDIWGSKSSSDPDTVYTIPSVRLGYLDGLKCGTYDCVGYGLYADNVYLNGTIISNSGQLGGFKIGANNLSNGIWGTDKSVLMSIGTTENKAIGGSSAISGWCFTAGSKFGVTTSGDLYASNANISGTINASKGTIGRFNITDTYLITGSDDTCTGMGENQAFWAGSNDSNNAPFHVGYDGSIYSIKGSVGGWNIENGKLYGGDGSADNPVAVMQMPQKNNLWTFAVGGTSHSNYSDCPFRVSKDGKMRASWASLAGWTITDGKIYSGDPANSGEKVSVMQIPTANTTWTFATGGISHDNYSDCPFRVSKDGRVFGTEVNVGVDDDTRGRASTLITNMGITINVNNSTTNYGLIMEQTGSSGNPYFGVTLQGKLFARSSSGFCKKGTVVCKATANTPTKTSVIFSSAFSAVPTVVVTPISAQPGTYVKCVSVSNVTTKGFDIYLNRIDANSTSVAWIAML
nr:MAG TPA: H-type lectin domain [Caudoviricetes sp.]